LAASLWTLPVSRASAPAADSPGRPWRPAELDFLKRALYEAGLDSADFAGLKPESLRCYPSALKLNLHGRDAAEYYRSFQDREVIEALEAFLRRRADLLAAEEGRSGVPRQVLGAILMIESRLGRNWGAYRVPDLLLSLQLLRMNHGREADLDSAQARESREGGGRSRVELARELRRRAERRSRWALQEFLSLREQFPRGRWPKLLGSWAGAMGIPQFLPTSLAAYGADGDADGVIDLYHMPDAVASVGNYLRQNGWRGIITEAKRRKAIRSYNHSDHYVDAVLLLARSAGLPPQESSGSGVSK